MFLLFICLDCQKYSIIPFHLHGLIVYIFMVHVIVSAWMSKNLQLMKRHLAASVVHHFFRIAYTYHGIKFSDTKPAIAAGYFVAAITYRVIMSLTNSMRTIAYYWYTAGSGLTQDSP